MGGEDIRGAGGIDSDSVSTESATVTNEADAGSVSTESATVTNEVDAGSVNTGSLNDGIAGTGNSTSLIPYDDGDLIHVASFDFWTEGEIQISSTSFTDLSSNGPQLDTLSVFGDGQNLGDIKTLVTGTVNSVDSQVIVRTVISPDSEITLTQTGPFGRLSDIGDSGYSSGRLRPEGKVDSGTATVDALSIHFFREVSEE